MLLSRMGTKRLFNHRRTDYQTDPPNKKARSSGQPGFRGQGVRPLRIFIPQELLPHLLREPRGEPGAH